MAARRRLYPDARQTLLLRAALDAASSATRAWTEYAQSASLDQLDEGSTRLLPLVWTNLTRQGAGAEVAGLADLERFHHTARDANARLLREAGEVLLAFAAAGVPTIVLKGAALVGTVYDDLGARPVSDMDVLVPGSRIDDAAAVLRSLGFSARDPMTAAARRYTHAVLWRRPGAIPVDLHWHVYEECCRPADDDSLWAAALPIRMGEAPTKALSMEDQCIHACVHGEKWVNVPGFRWVADAVTILRRHPLDWDRVVQQAAARGFAIRLRAQLAWLADTFGAPVPASALAALGAVRSGWVERLEQRCGVRDTRRPWVLVYACNHLRASRGPLTAALTFPRYLQAVWRLESLSAVPRAGLDRVRRRPRP